MDAFLLVCIAILAYWCYLLDRLAKETADCVTEMAGRVKECMDYIDSIDPWIKQVATAAEAYREAVGDASNVKSRSRMPEDCEGQGPDKKV